MNDSQYIADPPALPFLTEEMGGIEGGIIKFRFEDFIVEEIPLYQPSGEGDHTYLFIEKQGMATMDALNQIAHAINYPRKQIGYAGLKDARAITRQWISLEHLSPEKLQMLSLPGLQVLQVAQHSNKLRIGHLAGNRFTLRLRKITQPLKEAHRCIEEILEVLAQRGVPNYFGPQRFGNRYDGQLLGEHIVKGNYEWFIDQMLGQPGDADSSNILVARQYYEQGDYEKSLAAWPTRFHDHHRALKALITSGGDKKRAYNAVDKHMKRFFISAYQSELFNQVLAARMPDVDRLLRGDMAMKHE
ncbi:MAG: tRNA pseudouridine(13) synthase TruD, partial [Sedimentisphaerales bacterium]|nr:tRNA pseudouridine(13) synthase TruD [Sedimentisphaerales bacterium]